MSIGCYLGFTWVLLGCYLGLTGVSLECNLGVTWMSLALALALKQNTFQDYHRPSIRLALPTTWPLATKRWWDDHDENVWRNPSIIWPHLWEWTIEVTTEPPYPRPEGWLKAKLWLHSLLLLFSLNFSAKYAATWWNRSLREPPQKPPGMNHDHW